MSMTAGWPFAWIPLGGRGGGGGHLPGDDDWKDASPDGKHWNDHESGCAKGANDVGPDAGAIVQAVENGQPRLNQWTVP